MLAKVVIKVQVHNKTSMASSDIAWARSNLQLPLMKSNNVFSDIDDIKSFPKCVKPLHLIWKLSAITWHGRNDISIFWDIWAWVFRILVILFSACALFPHTFTGINSLYLFVETSPYFIVRLSLIGAITTYQITSIYPIIFGAWYIHKGHLHQLIENLLCVKYVKEEYFNNTLPQRLNTVANRCKWFCIICVLFQFIGWMIVNLTDKSHDNGAPTGYWIFASILFPFCWATLKWFPFCAAFSILIIVLEILRIEKDLYISQIGASQQNCKCKTAENKLYFVFNDIDDSNVTRIETACDVERHLTDSYLNMVGLASMHSKYWRYYILLIVLSGFFSVLSAVSLVYYCDKPPLGSIIMLPAIYVLVSVFFLYELADLNAASDDTKTLLSATRLGKYNKKKNDGYYYQINVNQILKMMEYNPIQVSCAGLVFTYGTVNALTLAVGTIIATSLAQYFFPTLAEST